MKKSFDVCNTLHESFEFSGRFNFDSLSKGSSSSRSSNGFLGDIKTQKDVSVGSAIDFN